MFTKSKPKLTNTIIVVTKAGNIIQNEDATNRRIETHLEKEQVVVERVQESKPINTIYSSHQSRNHNSKRRNDEEKNRNPPGKRNGW